MFSLLSHTSTISAVYFASTMAALDDFFDYESEHLFFSLRSMAHYRRLLKERKFPGEVNKRLSKYVQFAFVTATSWKQIKESFEMISRSGEEDDNDVLQELMSLYLFFEELVEEVIKRKNDS